MSEPTSSGKDSHDTWLQKTLRQAHVDRPVFFGLLAKVWGLAAVPISLFLIAKIFSPVLQGYYFTFSNLIALQVFVELGLGTVLIQFASHEWSRLRLGPDGDISGDPDALSRLISLMQLAVKWFFAGGLIVIFAVGGGGHLFFTHSTAHDVAWKAPWFALSFITGLTVWLVPAWSLLEGCNQVSKLYQFRFYQGIIGSLSLWISIFLGAKLWVLVIATGVMLLAGIFFIMSQYTGFFRQLLFGRPTSDVIQWRKHIFPMQWKIALSWASGYFSFSIFTPVLFHYHGPVIAGQFGMTWTLVSSIGRVAGVWFTPKAPLFGILIARREFVELNRLFRRIMRFFFWLVMGLSAGCWLLVEVVSIFYPVLASRLLSPLSVGLLLTAQFIAALSFPFSVYLRAHKQEPLLILSVATGILTAISTLFLGKYFSATGIAGGYLFVSICTVPFVFLIWCQCQKKWHGPFQKTSTAGDYLSGLIDESQI